MPEASGSHFGNIFFVRYKYLPSVEHSTLYHVGMPNAPLPPLAELLRRSRELRTRLAVQAGHAEKLKESVERSKKRLTSPARFCPE